MGCRTLDLPGNFAAHHSQILMIPSPCQGFSKCNIEHQVFHKALGDMLFHPGARKASMATENLSASENMKPPTLPVKPSICQNP